jgi:Chaperone of endosialidase
LKDRTFWFRLYGEGNGYAYTTADNSPSDIRFKTALRPIGNALEKVLQLRGTSYRWSEAGLAHLMRHISEQISAGPDATAEDNQKLWDAERQKAHEASSGDHIGLIAQELETVVPELVHEDQEGYKYIRYPQLTALLVEAIKEQNAMIQSRLAALDAR